jgi:hypothetical protein
MTATSSAQTLSKLHQAAYKTYAITHDMGGLKVTSSIRIDIDIRAFIHLKERFKFC